MAAEELNSREKNLDKVSVETGVEVQTTQTTGAVTDTLVAVEKQQTEWEANLELYGPQTAKDYYGSASDLLKEELRNKCEFLTDLGYDCVKLKFPSGGEITSYGLLKSGTSPKDKPIENRRRKIFDRDFPSRWKDPRSDPYDINRGYLSKAGLEWRMEWGTKMHWEAIHNLFADLKNTKWEPVGYIAMLMTGISWTIWTSEMGGYQGALTYNLRWNNSECQHFDCSFPAVVLKIEGKKFY